ncbi:hypothetical protein [Acidithiobacillus ferriphilus]|nr:hypothetical protein [Acidithiobacillus ferriphilus]
MGGTQPGSGFQGQGPGLQILTGLADVRSRLADHLRSDLDQAGTLAGA